MSDRKSCVRCGRTIDAAARLCPFCNWDQEAPVPAADPNAAFAAPAYVPPEETAWRKYVFGGVGAVVLVLLAFVVGAQLQKRKNVTPPVPKGSPAAMDTAPAVPAPAAPSTNVTLVPDNSPVKATTDQAYTSAPVSSTAQGLASQTDRADATAVSSSEYAQLAQRAAAEAAQRKKTNALVDPRSISGQPYGTAPAPLQRRAPAATLAQQIPGMTSAAPPSMVPAAAAVVRVGPIPERQPMPVLRGRRDMSAAVEVTVAPDGRVTDVNVLQPLPGDDTARLIAAVQNWQFRPATENGVPVASRFRTTLFFHAHGR